MGRSDESNKRNEINLRRKIKTQRKKMITSKRYYVQKDEPKVKSSSDSDEKNAPEQLRPISDYVNNRREMVKQMFNSIRGRHLNLILPDVMKDVPLAELQRLCVEQLDVMSKKRIRYILAGKEMTSSSGTEDSESGDESFPENSVHCEVPQPASTSTDQLPAAIEETIKESIESDEDFSGIILKNDAAVIDKIEHKSVDRSEGSVELEEPVFDFVFNTSDDDDDLRTSILPNRTAVDFDSDENEKENEMDSGVKINKRTNKSDKNEIECSSFSPDTNRSETPIRKKSLLNECSENDLKEKSVTSDVSDNPKRNRSVKSSDDENPEYDGDSELEDGEIRRVKKRMFKHKKMKASNYKRNFSNEYEEKICSNEQEINGSSFDSVPACDDAADRQNLPTDDLQACGERSKTLPEENNADVFELNDAPSKELEENLNLPFDDDEPLDCDLLPKDDVWMHYDVDTLCDSNKNEDDLRASTNVSVDERLEFVDCASKEKATSVHAIDDGCNEFRPKLPPGVVLDDQASTDDDDFEQYESDEGAVNDDNDDVVPPGLEKSVELMKTVSENVHECCEPSTSGAESVPKRKTSIVPIKTLYQQLKKQNEMKKVIPKIYGAQLPSWSITMPIKTAGPCLPTTDEFHSVHKLSAEKEKLIAVADDCDVSSSPKKVKKKSTILTKEFLDDLKKQKEEHESEMMRKEAMLEKLKEKRLAMIQQEKETEEILKKRNDLGLPSSSSNDDGDSTKCELYLFDDDQSSFIFSEDEVKKVDSREHEEGECSADEQSAPVSSSVVVVDKKQSCKVAEMKSFSVSLNEHGSRSIIVNKKADNMKSAFSLEHEKSDEETKFGTYRRSRSSSRQRSSTSHGRYDGDRDDRYKNYNRNFVPARYDRRSDDVSVCRRYDRRRDNYSVHPHYDRLIDEPERRRYDHPRPVFYERIDHRIGYDDRNRRTKSRSVRSHSSKSSSEKETSRQKIVNVQKESRYKKVHSPVKKRYKKDDISLRDDKKPTAKKIHVEPLNDKNTPIVVVENPKTSSNQNKSIAVDQDKVTVQKLELYELEMRARAIRALMKKQELENK